MLTKKTEKNISQVEVLVLSEDSPEEILKIILYIFSSIIEKMDSEIFRFSDIKITIKKPRISFIKQTNNVSFETKKLYDYLLNKITEFLPEITYISFNSIYSALYFRRIIKYLSELMNLMNLNEDIANDKIVKLFFYLFFLSIEEYFNNKNLKYIKKK